MKNRETTLKSPENQQRTKKLWNCLEKEWKPTKIHKNHENQP